MATAAKGTSRNQVTPNTHLEDRHLRGVYYSCHPAAWLSSSPTCRRLLIGIARNHTRHDSRRNSRLTQLYRSPDTRPQSRYRDFLRGFGLNYISFIHTINNIIFSFAHQIPFSFFKFTTFKTVVFASDSRYNVALFYTLFRRQERGYV